MRFEDERYVRLYTRDTTTWLMLPWQSRCVLMALFRKVDRAGVWELGDDGVEGLSVVLALPPEVVEPGLVPLLKRGTVVVQGGTLLIPNFLEAQEAKQSDKARQRSARERARDVAAAGVTLRDQPSRHVTIGHTDSDPVTRGHTASQPVTPSLPSRADLKILRDPKLAGQFVSEDPLPSTTGPSPGDSVEPRKVEKWESEIRDVLEHWALQCYPDRKPKFTPNRRARVRARLNERYTVEDLKKAVDGCALSEWHYANKKRDIELICRDGSHVEAFIDLVDHGEPASSVRLAVAEPVRPSSLPFAGYGE